MQALLLLKQTLNVGYAPGALVLSGANVRLNSLNDARPHNLDPSAATTPFTIRLDFNLESLPFVEIAYRARRDRSVVIEYMTFSYRGHVITLREGMPSRGLRSMLKNVLDDEALAEFTRVVTRSARLSVVSYRCFLDLSIDEPESTIVLGIDPFTPSPSAVVGRRVEDLIHLPGLRGNPERSYPVSSTENRDFPGTFENYTASLLRQWQLDREISQITGVARDLAKLGLTSRIQASMRSDSAVEILVGRLPSRSSASSAADDLVNIADVGIGISQVLPLIVALHAAEPMQIVYVEQPELHLHPKSQVALANVIVDAVKRGVYVVMETHSSLLLLAIQTLVAESVIDPSAVALNWFKRNRRGQTIITQGELDIEGRFGGWPADFADIELSAEGRYLEASFAADQREDS